VQRIPDAASATTGAIETTMNDVNDNPNQKADDHEPADVSTDLGRRKMLGQLLAGAKLLTGTATVTASGSLFSREEAILAATLTHQGTAGMNVAEPDGLSGMSQFSVNWARLNDLKKKMATAKLGSGGIRARTPGNTMNLSRMFIGGNLVSGWAHARDLIYVSDLVKAYHTKEKIFDTLQISEACGMNTFLMNPALCNVVREYREKAGGTIQFMTNCSGNTEEELLGNLQKSIDYGASSCLVQGEVGDRLVREKRFDQIAKSLELVRKNGLPAGIAAHRLETLQACVDEGLIPDFWMKTFHSDNYWSRRPGEPECDNVFCREPQATIDFMAQRPEPWIAFKVLAAGAIKPQDGFRYAFEGGADFICVGMYDFQVVDSVNICMDVLDSPLKRTRPWRYA